MTPSDLPGRVTAVVTCKGRLPHLEKSLPRLVEAGLCGVVLVDYDCPQGCGLWAQSSYPDVRVERVTNQAAFNLSDARNRGAAVAASEWILFIDADVIAQPSFADWMRQPLDSGGFYTCEPIGAPSSRSYGTLFVPKSAFDKVGGYDTLFRGWGGEDDDLTWRLWRAGLVQRHYPAHNYEVIAHPDALRTQFYSQSSKPHSNVLNKVYLAGKKFLLQRDEYRDVYELPEPVRQQLRAGIESQLSGMDLRPGARRSVSISFSTKSPQPGNVVIHEHAQLICEVEVP